MAYKSIKIIYFDPLLFRVLIEVYKLACQSLNLQIFSPIPPRSPQLRSTASTDFHLFDPLQGDSKLFINSELILIISSSHHSLIWGFHFSYRWCWSWQENVQILKRYLIYPPLIDMRSSFRVQCVFEATKGNKRLHMEKSTFHTAVIHLTTAKTPLVTTVERVYKIG